MPGTRFLKTDLLREVGQNYARRISKLQEELAEAERLTLSDQIKEWREREVARLTIFTARVAAGEVEDGELSRFEIKSMPYKDTYTTASLRQQIESAENARDKAMGYVRALAPVEVGGSVVEVSAVDLKRIGYGL